MVQSVRSGFVSLVGTAALGFLLGTAPARADDSLSHFLYPLATKALPTPNFTINTSEVPALAPWANEAKTLCKQWFPLISRFLATNAWKPPKTVRLVFKKELEVPAATGNDEISFDGRWIQQHPDDFGMVIHELIHVIQAYPSNPGDPGWLVEGIADYIRYWRYEPERPHGRIHPDKSSYRDGYGTTAAFLAWLVVKYDKRTIPTLDQALRKGQYSDKLFDQLTGKSLDTLWKEFVAVR